ncbi:hypothetical protein DH2020_019508 [Rehmannia glutinosa]|uniref:Biotin carboxyl carrier protein of acetyl-CoA carboxylase n=1 Tax=Rehmannia glutinosa TaxID=99300 RepID=A0ABR0WM15_REHGL
MASFSVPCPKVSPLLAAASSQSAQKRHCVASFPRSDSRSNPALMTVAQFQGYGRGQSNVFKVRAQLNEKISNASPTLEKPTIKSENDYEIPDASSISTFMTQVTDLVKLVDSKDIVELQLKQMDCELLIRKKEALPQSAPVFFQPPPARQTMQPPHSPPASVPAPVASYDCLLPYACQFSFLFLVSQIGDKVKKGQVICIIEAMKLMNEIEADHSGTVTEILADDGKPVSVDTVTLLAFLLAFCHFHFPISY